MRGSAFSVVLLLAALAGCTCGPRPREARSERSGAAAPEATPHPAHEPHGEAAPEALRFEESAGGIAWHAEEPLVARRPSSSMRAAEYVVRDHAGAELAVFHFGAGQGGSVDDNVARWIDQFDQPDGRSSRDVAVIERAEVNGIRVTKVDVSGSFAGMRGMGGDGPAQPGYRMLGAIAEGPGGMVFFKLTGPADAVGAAETAFERLLASLHPS